MVIRIGPLPHELAQSRIGRHRRSRQEFAGDPLGKSPRGENVAGALHGVHQAPGVVLGAQVIRVDQRLVQRIAAGQPHPAARGRPHHARQNADRVGVLLADDDVERHMDEGDLNVRPALRRIGLVEQRRFRQIQMARRHGPRGSLNHPGEDVVVEVLADAGQRRHDRNGKLLELVWIADAG